MDIRDETMEATHVSWLEKTLRAEFRKSEKRFWASWRGEYKAVDLCWLCSYKHSSAKLSTIFEELTAGGAQVKVAYRKAPAFEPLLLAA